MQKIKSLSVAALTLMFLIVSAQVSAGPKNSRGNSKSLSKSESQTLMFMREEEKMARDVYLTSYDLWEDTIFNNIAGAEQQHMDALKVLLDKYRLPDPVFEEIGFFQNPGLQELYDDLVAQSEESRIEALYVGALIEEVDIIDLVNAINESRHLDVINVYEKLLRGSRNHLRSFVRKIENEGLVYEAQLLSQEEVDEIVDTPMERGR